ncbi:unnamed protein product, partial [Allacma fusca]
MASVTSTRVDTVDKLIGPNYKRWKWQIKNVLEAADLLEIVDGTEPAPAADKVSDLKKWKKKDAQAPRNQGSSANLAHRQNKGTSAHAWVAHVKTSNSTDNVPAVEGPAQTRYGFSKSNSNESPAYEGTLHALAGATESHLSEVWVSDSGASEHISGNIGWFASMKMFTTNAPTINLATQDQIRAKGIGIVRLEALIDSKWEEVSISNVLFVPGAANLFSEIQMAKIFTITRKGDLTRYLKDGGGAGPTAVLQ